MHNFVHIDTNSKYPNLVLMKLSAWIKSKLQPGTYNIDLLKPADVLNGYNMFRQYDVLYGACVFSENKHLADALAAKGVSVGGSGTGKYEITLRPDQEHIMPDYSLYGITSFYRRATRKSMITSGQWCRNTTKTQNWQTK